MLDLPDIEEFPKNAPVNGKGNDGGLYQRPSLDEYKDVLEGYHTTQDVYSFAMQMKMK